MIKLRMERFVEFMQLRVGSFVPFGLVSVVIGLFAIRAILSRIGHPSVPLDDAFIHLQYAKQLSQGHFFEYSPGDGYTSGATSFLLPIVLAPFFWLGFKELSILYIVWAIGALSHAALAWEASQWARSLSDRSARIGAALLCFSFGAFIWFAYSGMETIPFAWLLLRAGRKASDYYESTEPLSRVHWIHLIVSGAIVPLVRPEGHLGALLVFLSITLKPGSLIRHRALSLLVWIGSVLVPLLHWMALGHSSSSTMQVKWLFLNPYYDMNTLRQMVLSNMQFFWDDIANGGVWTALFLPAGFRVVLAMSLVLTLLIGIRQKKIFRAVCIVIIALGALLSCTYSSFLWNRLRYVWPFASAWMVMLACATSEMNRLVQRVFPQIEIAGALILGAIVALFGSRLPWVLSDLAESSDAIYRQQVSLGLWARNNLPRASRIGVNDTGAISYLSNHATFDVVGLTTEGEAPYWVWGAGSRFEHYEKLPRERFPTHFIVYPHWMNCSPVLGAELTERTVLDQSILGGATMFAYESNTEYLGSGENPALMLTKDTLVDMLDVADIESEKAHHYVLGNTTEAQNRVQWAELPSEEKWIADGGRFDRSIDQFNIQFPKQREAHLVMRVWSDEAASLTIAVDEHPVTEVVLTPFVWNEPVVSVTADCEASCAVKVTATKGTFHSFHYWVYRDL